MLLPATPGWVSLPVVVGGPRHSWLGSAGGGGVWCVVCGGGVLVGLWLVCGVVGPSPLLAEVPVCYSPPLLAGFLKVLPWVVVGAGGLGAGKTRGAGTRGVFLDVVIGGRTRDTDTNGGESSDNRSKVHADCGPAENPSL